MMKRRAEPESLTYEISMAENDSIRKEGAVNQS
jgi:hypothetical protein